MLAVDVEEVEIGETQVEANKESLQIAETAAVAAKPGSETFIRCVLQVWDEKGAACPGREAVL